MDGANLLGEAPRPCAAARLLPVPPTAATSWVIAITGVPLADAMTINARRIRTESCLPRRTSRCSVCPS
jgi:hypothetical protein